jgi:hypothetical protein
MRRFFATQEVRKRDVRLGNSVWRRKRIDKSERLDTKKERVSNRLTPKNRTESREQPELKEVSLGSNTVKWRDWPDTNERLRRKRIDNRERLDIKKRWRESNEDLEWERRAMWVEEVPEHI